MQGGIRAPQEEQDQRCRLDPRGIKARSSSHIASQEPYSFEPEKALDGRAETSWCVNTKTHGVGEWIELELPVDPARPAVPEALYIIPGLAATQSLWEANGRLSRILVGPCGSKGTSIPLSVADDYLDAMVEVKGAAKVLGDLFKAGETKACLRLEIAEVLPGKKYQDTCVSEIALSLRCR